MKNICLFFGGKSCEHDISIITASQILCAIDLSKYKVLPIYINKNNEWFLVKNFNSPKEFLTQKLKYKVYLMPGSNKLYQKNLVVKNLGVIDCCILACHGMNGEDGTLQGLLELSGIPYTSSGVCSSAIIMDKVFMKQVFEVNNLPITNYVWFFAREYKKAPKKILKQIKQNLEYPIIVKPANLGSSIGITKCSHEEEAITAISVALNYDTKIVVEEVVPHLKEINCACMGYGDTLKISNLDEPLSWESFLSFEQKYLNFNNVKFENPTKSNFSTELTKKVKDITKFAFQKLNCSGVVRIDFLYNSDTEELFINEINTIPGSLSNFMFDMPFTEMLDFLIENSKLKFNEKNSCTFTYDSQVLKNLDSGFCKLKSN